MDEGRAPEILDLYERTEKKAVGEGTYGEVFKARCKRSDRIVALKRIKLDGEDEGIPSTAIREISLLKEMKHPNIVELIEQRIDVGDPESTAPKKLWLVFEFVDQDLKRFTKARGKLEPDLVRNFSHQLLVGLEHCHLRRLIHRDLKPQNLLVDEKNMQLKIADFGLARALSLLPIPKFTHEVVTVWYRCPEILLGAEKYAYPVDCWSVGCIIAEMASLTPLFPGDSEIDTIFRIFRKLGTPTTEVWESLSDLPCMKSSFPQWKPRGLRNINRLPEVLGNLGIEVVDALLRYDPRLRVSAKRALQMEYFAGMSPAPVVGRQ
jgi:serine/threonine protein kinase